MIRVLLDVIVLVLVVCLMYVALVYQAPIFFLLGCIVGIILGYVLKEDLKNASQ